MCLMVFRVLTLTGSIQLGLAITSALCISFSWGRLPWPLPSASPSSPGPLLKALGLTAACAAPYMYYCICDVFVCLPSRTAAVMPMQGYTSL